MLNDVPKCDLAISSVCRSRFVSEFVYFDTSLVLITIFGFDLASGPIEFYFITGIFVININEFI